MYQNYVGIGTTIPLTKLHVVGDIVCDCNITNSKFEPILGVLANWQATPALPTFTLPSGALTYTNQKSTFRFSGNEIIYNVNIAATVTSAPTSTTSDYLLNVPYAVNTAWYPTDAVVGELWLTVSSNISPATSNVFKAYARTRSTDASNVTVRYLTATTDASMCVLGAGASIVLQGNIIYVSSASSQLNTPAATTPQGMQVQQQAVALVGSGFKYQTTQTPPVLSAPTATPSAATAFAPTTATAFQRYMGTEISMNVAIAGVIYAQPTDTTLDWKLSVPYPVDLATTYGAAPTRLGECVLNVVSTAGYSNTFPAYVRTIPTDSNNVAVRFLNGTADAALSTVATSNAISLAGTFTYQTTSNYNGSIYLTYIPPVFQQDTGGNVVLNGNGYQPRAKLDIIQNSVAQPALLVDQYAAGGKVATFNASGYPVLTIGRDGLFYDSNMTATWIPGSTLRWIDCTTTFPPAITAGNGSLSLVARNASYRYIGTEVVYNFYTSNVVGTQSTTDYTLALPYPLDTAKYGNNGVVGELWLGVVNAAGTFTNTYKSYARSIAANSGAVTLRYLNGSADSGYADFATGARLTLQGTLTYTSPNVANNISLPPSVVPAAFVQDQTGQVSFGSGQQPTAKFDIYHEGTGTAVNVTKTSNVGNFLTMKVGAESRATVGVDGNVTLGAGGYPYYATLGVTSNVNPPSSTGTINGVNITALNKRTRTSYASAVECVSTWTARASAVDNEWRSICWAAELSLFVAVAVSGTGNRVMTSPDGITWTARTPASDNNWTSVCWAPELSIFVAVADTGMGNRVMTSPNGIIWTTRTSAADNAWFSVCWSPELSLFVSVAQSGIGDRVMTSPNGITWTTRQSAADNNWRPVCWAPELSLFVAAAASGTGDRVMTSPDGITWTARTSAPDNNWLSLCWSPELSIFVAVGTTGVGNRVMTSPDGITWTARTSAADNNWHSVCWVPEISIFVAVAWSGTGNRVMTSPNGINWTTRTSAADNQWLSLCWAPELSMLVAVANSGTGNRVMTSIPATKSFGNIDIIGHNLAPVSSAPHVTFNGSAANQNVFLRWLQRTTATLAGSWWQAAATPTYSTIAGAPGSNAYFGGVLLPDGRVVFVPHNATTIGIFNPANNTYSTIAGAPGSFAYFGGVLLPDGRMVFVPSNATTIGIFNPANNTYSTIAGAPGSLAYAGGVLLPDGRVVFVPLNATTIGIFNPNTNTYSTIAGAPGSSAYAGGVLLPDGRVVFVPYSATTIGIFNPANNTYSTIAGAPGSSAYAGGVLLPDGRVVFVPYSATTIGIFNPANNTYSTIAGAPGSGAYAGGVLLPDGRVVFVPLNATTIGIFNPNTNTYSTIAGAPGSLAYYGGVLLSDGRVVFVPRSATTIGILSGFPLPPPELCYHPCFNKL